MRSPWLLIVLIVPAFSTVGCGDSDTEAVTPAGGIVQNRLTTIYQLYSRFVNARGQAPKDAMEFRKFAESLPPTQGPVKLTEEFLVSPRDQKPIVIRYGLPLRPDGRFGSETEGASRAGPNPSDGPVIAHEQVGSGNRRFVVFAGSGRVELVDAGKARELGLD